MEIIKPLKVYCFSWQNEKAGRLTPLVETTREFLRGQVVKQVGQSWPEIYKRGGRIMQCTIVPK